MAHSLDQVKEKFIERFGFAPTLIIRSPGRINLIGEHTDYNLGYVLPAAIDKGIWMALSKSEGATIIHAIDLGREIILNDFDNLEPFDNGWANYVVGLVDQLQKAGISINNFNCVFGGDIPIGSGLSSSAALENATCFGLNELLELGLSKMEMIKFSQKAEHEFVGVKCGIMDMFTSMMGEKEKVIRLDCRSLEYKTFPLQLDNYELLLLNSNVAHSLASSEYNTRRNQCREGVHLMKQKFSEVDSLRDVDMIVLNECKADLPELVFRRCKYIVEENLRVLAFCEALLQKDFGSIRKLLFAAQAGMKNEYEITCPEIDFLVDYSFKYPGVIGARMMGGGFGGCTINIIERKRETEFIEKIKTVYFKEFGLEANPIKIKINKGVRRVD